MRQIPSYCVIGSGRLAKHLSHYFSLSNIAFNSWSRAHHSFSKLEELVSNSDIILLLINDDAIAHFIEQILATQNFATGNKILVHCSGSLYTDRAISIHPLMSFGHTLYDYETYKKMPFIIDDGTDFTTIFPTLQNPYYQINPKLKAYYHALCVISGNFTSILWAKFFDELEAIHIPKEAAYPYLESICTNLKTDYLNALTGPLIRGDDVTINKNLTALAQDDFLPIYQAFQHLYRGKI